MPRIGDTDVSPNDAIKQGCCPECGASLKTLSPKDHAFTHYGAAELIPPEDAEALGRYKLLMDYKP